MGSPAIARLLQAARAVPRAGGVGLPALLTGYAAASDSVQLGTHPALACVMIAADTADSACSLGGDTRAAEFLAVLVETYGAWPPPKSARARTSVD